MYKRYADREEAGLFLASELADYANAEDGLILGLPRGGIPIGYHIARILSLPLDVFLVRKLGVPGHEELAMGAIAEGGVTVMNEQIVSALDIQAWEIEEVVQREHAELERRARLYRGNRAPHPVKGKTVILVDDGLATGATMRAAVRAVRQKDPARVVVAVPVAPPETCDALSREADEVHCGLTPGQFTSVGSWYEDFSQVSDEEVRELLEAPVGAKQEKAF